MFYDLLDRFILLQTREHFASPILKLKPLASALSLNIMCQNSGILSLVTSITFGAFQTALKTHLYKQRHN